MEHRPGNAGLVWGRRGRQCCPEDTGQVTKMEHGDSAVDRFLVLAAFGETILRFQLLELTFWTILAARLKSGITVEQGMAKVTGWDSQSMGRLVGALGLPPTLEAEAEEAVKTRNYLAHRYMRDRAMCLEDSESCQRVAIELAQVQARLDDFEVRLETYMKDLGVSDLTETELQDLGLDLPPSEYWLGRGSKA